MGVWVPASTHRQCPRERVLPRVPDEVTVMGSFSQGLEARLSLNRVRVLAANRVDSLAGVSMDADGAVGRRYLV